MIVVFCRVLGQNRLRRRWRCVASGKVSWCAKEERGEETFLMCNTSRTFNVQHILNFQFATNIEFFYVQKILHFQYATKILNFQSATHIQFSMWNKYRTSSVQHILNFKCATNIEYSKWKASQILFWQHQLVPKLKGQKHIPPYALVTWLVSLFQKQTNLFYFLWRKLGRSLVGVSVEGYCFHFPFLLRSNFTALGLASSNSAFPFDGKFKRLHIKKVCMN